MNHQMNTMQLSDFAEQLASSAPVPGGGGVAALVGSLAAALASMATNLTMGKAKFLSFEEDHRSILAETGRLRGRLLELMDEDANAFEPLSRLYSTDRNVPDYPEQFRLATLNACGAPYEMMQCCSELIAILENLRGKCSVLLLSDVGCAALTAGAALEAAAMNVFVNTRLLSGDSEAERIAAAATAMLSRDLPRARAVAESVMTFLRSTK